MEKGFGAPRNTARNALAHADVAVLHGLVARSAAFVARAFLPAFAFFRSLLAVTADALYTGRPKTPPKHEIRRPTRRANSDAWQELSRIIQKQKAEFEGTERKL